MTVDPIYATYVGVTGQHTINFLLVSNTNELVAGVSPYILTPCSGAIFIENQGGYLGA